MALSPAELDGINGPGAFDALAAHRTEQARLADVTAQHRIGKLATAATESGTVTTGQSQVVAEEARTTAQQAIVGGELAADTVAPGESAFLPGTTTPLGEGGVTINTAAPAPQPEVQVNPPTERQ